MSNNNLQELRKKLESLARLVKEDIPIVLKTEGLKFIQKNFQDEGFNDESLQKWQPRKTTDTRGRDLTRYRSDRVGKKGTLTPFGKRNQGRAILTGYNSGGKKLLHSFMAGM